MMIQIILAHVMQVLVVTAALLGIYLLRDYLFIAMLLLFGIAAIVLIAVIAIIASPIIALFLILSKPKIKIISKGSDERI